MTPNLLHINRDPLPSRFDGLEPVTHKRAPTQRMKETVKWETKSLIKDVNAKVMRNFEDLRVAEMRKKGILIDYGGGKTYP